MANETLKDHELQERIRMDQNRDPVDATKDAEALVGVLTQVAQVVFDQSTSYALRHRLRTDLMAGDLSVRLYQAHELLRANRRRLNELQHMQRGK